MANRRDDGWEDNYEVFTADQIESILGEIGVQVVSQTGSHFLCYCPFHANRDTAAFAVDKTLGLFTCFNPSCDTSGTLDYLITFLTGKNLWERRRLVLKYKNFSKSSLDDLFDEEPPEFPEFPQKTLDRLYDNFWQSDVAQTYMYGRHFSEGILRLFRVGFSPAMRILSAKGNPYLRPEMITVPMHSPDGLPIGLIGRSIKDKIFKNSDNLPKSLTAWNLHRAKRHGATVIIVESSFDAMRVHQAGYPNVIALLGGTLSQQHISLIGRYFDTIIIMTDFDMMRIENGLCKLCSKKECRGCRPGRKLGHAIVKAFPTKRILWAAFDNECVYPYKPLENYRIGPAKDVGDMTDDEIVQSLRNAITNFEYRDWEIEQNVLPWEHSDVIM